MDGLEMKVMRVRAGLSQWDLAKRTNKNPARISEMETGKREVDSSVVRVLFEALGVEQSIEGEASR